MSKNRECVYKMIGASNHSDSDRAENDFYATDPDAVRDLLNTGIKFNNKILEPCAGNGSISKVLLENGFTVESRDLVQRDFKLDKVEDFLSSNTYFDGDVITNPPYTRGLEFVAKALNSVPMGNHVAMLLKLSFLEGKERYNFYKKNPPKYVYVFSKRIVCAKNGQFYNEKGVKYGSAVAYAWYVWERGFSGEPVIRWIDPNA